MLALGGRMLGVPELYGMAAGAAALVIAAAVWVRYPELHIEADRELRPARVHAGSASRVELAVANGSSRQSPLVTAVDSFDKGRRRARFLVAPLAAGEVARGAYRLPTERRGVFELGPLVLERHDPFGIAATTVEIARVTELTVYPRVDEIEPLPSTLGQDPMAGADHPTSLGPAGDEFYSLREYEVGDDLRRVHWKSTAKLDELMIRQDEMPWQGRATIVADLRSHVHTPESLELVVSAAASVALACRRHRALLRLVTTGGTDSGFGATQEHGEAILERLALAGTGDGDLRAVLASLRRSGHSGALTLITTAGSTDGDLSAAARLSTRFGHVAVVLFDRSAYDPWARAAGTRRRRLPATVAGIRVTGDVPFALAWDEAMLRARSRGRAVVR